MVDRERMKDKPVRRIEILTMPPVGHESVACSTCLPQATTLLYRVEASIKAI